MKTGTVREWKDSKAHTHFRGFLRRYAPIPRSAFVSSAQAVHFPSDKWSRRWGASLAVQRTGTRKVALICLNNPPGSQAGRNSGVQVIAQFLCCLRGCCAGDGKAPPTYVLAYYLISSDLIRFVLFCPVLFYAVLFFRNLFFSVVSCFILVSSILLFLFYPVLFCPILFWCILLCSAVFCSILFNFSYSVAFYSALLGSDSFLSLLLYPVLCAACCLQCAEYCVLCSLLFYFDLNLYPNDFWFLK